MLDFSAGFSSLAGAGLRLQVMDSSGVVLASGQHFLLRATQGQILTIRVYGVKGSDGKKGDGAYTLDIVALPQLISVEGQSLLPGSSGRTGGATASLVLTFQGDRLDQSAAENPANYKVTWLGPDGIADTNDDRSIAIDAGDAQPVVYNPSATSTSSQDVLIRPPSDRR